MITIGNNWDALLSEEYQKEYFHKLSEFVDMEYMTNSVYPPKDQLFSIFDILEVEDIKVVIIGQDPYHQPGQAHGMAFSVMPGVKKPPSLVNIFKELKEDVGCEIKDTGYLLGWARQGVFLMNTCLSVIDSKPNSHKGKGWEIFTDEVIRLIDEDNYPKVFLLWGNDARKKRDLIKNKKHLVLETVHPSPLSAYNGFFGCRHFSKANRFLKENMRKEIDWCNL